MDSRFSLKVSFSIYHEHFEGEWNCNWTVDGSHEIDRRITEWFLNKHDEAYGKWQRANYELESGQRAVETKARELEELKRLREKYPDA